MHARWARRCWWLRSSSRFSRGIRHGRCTPAVVPGLRNVPIALGKVLQVTDGVASKVFRMLNDLSIEAIETGAERIAEDAIERWRPVMSHELVFV